MMRIENVEIRYFRSIYQVNLKDLPSLLVLSGRNDIGKSNILKALNLFFNNQTDWQQPFAFNHDFSHKRLAEVRRETIKGKQFVQITVHFNRGPHFEKSLPPRFSVTRTWLRDSTVPETRSNIDRLFDEGQVPTKNLDRAQASLGRFLTQVRFEYVPAIKDQQFFSYMLGALQDVILKKRGGKDDVAKALQELNDMVESEARELREEFFRVTKISTAVRLPTELRELFRAFSVATQAGDGDISINYRGDGIRSRFLPSLLHYVSRNSRLNYVWGFEEPENSLEHGLATELAKEMISDYRKTAQIFVTSHSPAFFGLRSPDIAIYRVYRHEDSTTAQLVHPAAKNNARLTQRLERELGLMDFQRELQDRYEAELKKIERIRESVIATENRVKEDTSPILLTEGKWDVLILEEAYRRLYPKRRRSFRIIACDTHPDDPDGGAGGASTLRQCLESARPDLPVTIGLFDRDTEGQGGFEKLGGKFDVSAANPDVKIQRAGAAGAILLPIIPGREAYAAIRNFVLEFLFSDEFLAKQVDGKGLALYQPKKFTRVDGIPGLTDETVSTELQYRRIKGDSKRTFAEKVVPTLPSEAFEHFRSIFEGFRLARGRLERLRKARPRLRNR